MVHQCSIVENDNHRDWLAWISSTWPKSEFCDWVHHQYDTSRISYIFLKNGRFLPSAEPLRRCVPQHALVSSSSSTTNTRIPASLDASSATSVATPLQPISSEPSRVDGETTTHDNHEVHVVFPLMDMPRMVMRASFDGHGYGLEYLTLKSGALVNPISEDKGGWMEVVCNDERGWVPTIYLRENSPRNLMG